MNESQERRPRRAYQSARRQQQAVNTRAEVLDAALLLFADRGWAGTGMRDVAREAGVSVETVYANFRSKSDLLMAAIDVGVVGDAEPVALADRPEFARHRVEAVARPGARAAAHLVTEILQRNGEHDPGPARGRCLRSGGGTTAPSRESCSSAPTWSKAPRWSPAGRSRPGSARACGP